MWERKFSVRCRVWPFRTQIGNIYCITHESTLGTAKCVKACTKQVPVSIQILKGDDTCQQKLSTIVILLCQLPANLSINQSSSIRYNDKSERQSLKRLLCSIILCLDRMR